MPLRHLFGPVTGAFAGRYLGRHRRDGLCLTFGPDAGTDLPVGPRDTWASLAARLPAGWHPDFVAVWLPDAAVPTGIWAATVPLVGLAAGWDRRWHYYRSALPRCDRVLADAAGVDALRLAGLAHAKPAVLYGLADDDLADDPASDRDIDVLFVGSLSAATHGPRLPWLAQLARLGGRRRVVVRDGVPGSEYRALLHRARIVFNRSARGGANRRTFEALAAGALLFQEAGNREVRALLEPGRDYVEYDAGNLADRLDHYLDCEAERAAIAAAGHGRAASLTFAAFWDAALAGLDTERPNLAASAARREAAPAEPGWAERAWLWAGDPGLAADLKAARVTGGLDSDGHCALARAVGDPAAAAESFAEALRRRPGDALAGLGRADALRAAGRSQEAEAAARSALADLDRAGDAPAWGRTPPAAARLAAEWERAGVRHAGDPAAETRSKRSALRWRLHALLAELPGGLPHYYEAAMARPDVPEARAALGCALARAGQVGDALSHLRRAAELNPFDAAAVRALGRALADAGDDTGRAALAADRRLLHAAAPEAVPAEAWFARPALASVLVVCCNGLDYTRQCLESVLAHTRAPYELILVDNGSADGTAAYLDAIGARPGPQRVEVIRNPANRGYPAAANQAAAAAGGQFVAFLNNDAVVPAGWLDGLAAWLERDPKAGAAGPVSNYAPPPQLAPIPYADPADGLADFAAGRRRAAAGRALEVPRLSGFCMVTRKSVLEEVGAFDERFGVGFFDDDDFGLRLRRAGYKLLVAEGVFVHHFGSRTFAALGIDTARQLDDNLARFRAKWGDAAAAGYRPLAPAPAAARRPTVSLCMIVKDEAHNLPDCLGGLAELFDEVVVADTGSSDDTRAVAARLGAKVVDFPWVDDFAAARNASLDAASGDWVMWLDADDRLDAANRARLKVLLAGLGGENAAYAMKCVCDGGGPGASATVVDHVRLFRRGPGVRWRYRVHEQILPAVRAAGGEVRWSDVAVRHVGYADAALRRRKLERDLRLLDLENAARPDDPFTLFNLGSAYRELGRDREALSALRRSLARSHPGDSIVRKLYALIAACHRDLGEPAEALAACREGRGHYPDDAELLFVEGLLLRAGGDDAAAEAAWRRALDGREGNHFASVDAALRGYKTRHNLAVLCLDGGRTAEAEALWQAALDEEPAFVPARLGLAELCLRQGRWAELEAEAARLDGPSPADAAAVRARGHMGRGEFANARRVLEPAVAARPGELILRVVLSHALLREGADLAAAERALREVIVLDPDNREAKHNLDVLLARGASPVTP